VSELTTKQVADQINERMTELKSQLAKSADLDMVKALEADYKEFRSKNEEVLKEFESKSTDLENRLKEQIDRMHKSGKQASPSQKSLRSAILEEFKTDKWQDFLQNRGEGASPKMDVKAVTWGGTDKVDPVVHNFMPFDIPVYPFYEPVDMRLILPVGTSDTASLDFPQRKALTGGVAPVAETTESQATDFTFEMNTVNAVRKATHTDVSRRALRSTNWLANWIAGQFQEEFVKSLNTDIIMGDGTGDSFNGLDDIATAWTAPASMQGKINTGESTLIDAVLAMRTGFYVATNAWPNALFVSPTTAWLLSGAKATTREFVNPNVFAVTNESGVLRIGGITIYVMKDVADDNAIMGLISQQTIELLNFDGITIDSTQYHDKNFTSNLVTFRLESDMLLPIYRPYCFVKADLSAVQTAITA
jgi:HK97 family phage major capsid protein